MRTIMECQAEVFRRSKKRMKTRRQRRIRTLLTCIPMVLCVCVLSVFLMRERAREAPEDALILESGVGGLSQDGYSDYSGGVVKITVTGKNFSKTFTDTQSLAQISEKLFLCGTKTPESNSTAGGGLPEETEHIYTGTAADSANKGYTITLVTPEGKNTEYCFAGNTLTNLTSNQAKMLSAKQVKELKDLLGIPNP